jgi:hypothetical protein
MTSHYHPDPETVKRFKDATASHGTIKHHTFRFELLRHCHLKKWGKLGGRDTALRAILLSYIIYFVSPRYNKDTDTYEYKSVVSGDENGRVWIVNITNSQWRRALHVSSGTIIAAINDLEEYGIIDTRIEDVILYDEMDNRIPQSRRQIAVNWTNYMNLTLEALENAKYEDFF